MLKMAWSLPRINPINKIMGKRIVIDKISKQKVYMEVECANCGWRGSTEEVNSARACPSCGSDKNLYGRNRVG